MAALALALTEMGTVTAELEIAEGLRSKLPPAIRKLMTVSGYLKRGIKLLGPVKAVRLGINEVMVSDGVAIKTFVLSLVIPAEAPS